MNVPINHKIQITTIILQHLIEQHTAAAFTAFGSDR